MKRFFGFLFTGIPVLSFICFISYGIITIHLQAIQGNPLAMSSVIAMDIMIGLFMMSFYGFYLLQN